MATFLGSSPAFLARPVAKPHLSCAQSSRPPSPQQPQPPEQQTPQPQAAPAARPKRALAAADSTDWVASSLTRRFGIGAGLAWVGFLAVGVVSEQLKTRFEVAQQQANTKDVEQEQEVVLPNGIRYYEMRVGGDVPRPGDLVVIRGGSRWGAGYAPAPPKFRKPAQDQPIHPVADAPPVHCPPEYSHCTEVEESRRAARG